MSTQQPAVRPPLPPFTLESAKEKVRLAEDGWNSRDAAKVRSPIRSIRNGAIAQSLRTIGRKRRRFSIANGRRSTSTV